MNLVKASSLKSCRNCWHHFEEYRQLTCCKGTNRIRVEAARHPSGPCQPQAVNFKPIPARKDAA